MLAFPTPAGESAHRRHRREGALLPRAVHVASRRQAVSCPRRPTIPSYRRERSRSTPQKIVDLTDRLQPDGRLEWDVPAGDWTIMRFGRRNNGATTRPAPQPGLGFECDKFDAAAFDAHFDAYVGKLLEKVGPRKQGRGWTMLHIDSWEMGAQNWTAAFSRGIPAASRLRSAAVSSDLHRTDCRQPRTERAVSLGSASDGPGAGDREPRRASQEARSPAWLGALDRAVRHESHVRSRPGRGGRCADVRILERRLRLRFVLQLLRGDLDCPHDRSTGRGGRGLHRGRHEKRGSCIRAR